MKKLNYFLTVVAGTMMLASCSNDKEVVEPNYDNAVQQIVLQVASNGDGLTTRAGRELLSDEAGQKIDVVDLYIVEGNATTIKKTKTFVWSGDNKESSNYNYGTMTTWNLKGNDQLTAGETYTLYAIGHSNSSNYDIKKYESVADLKNCIITINNDKKPEEIFAGSTTFTVNYGGNFSEEVTLHRQVAGAYFYVYNLPMLDGLDTTCKIQLVASDFNDQLVLGQFATEDIANNGNAIDVRYVVNGKNSSTSHTATETVVCSADIKDWYNNIVDNNKDGIADVSYEFAPENEGEKGNTEVYWISTTEANAKNDDGIKNRGGKGYVKGSIFASSFVLPFKRTDNQTLKLQIVKPGAEGAEDKILHTWNVNLPTEKLPTESTEEKPVINKYFTGTVGSEWSDDSASAWSINKYSIVRNHLYSVGTKAKVEPVPPTTENPNPDPDPNPNPDPKPEDPQDLSKVQSLTLKVNHNWEVIYKMELD